MKLPIHRHKLPSLQRKPGFALIATISVMIALAMLSLSTIELRSSQNGRAMAEAQGHTEIAGLHYFDDEVDEIIILNPFC